MDTNVETFKALIIGKHPNGVASDGRRYVDIPASELTNMVVSKFPGGVTNDGRKYADFLKPARAETGFEKSNRLSNTASQNQQFAEESKKSNSALGLLGNFGKSLVSNLASSEVGLGKTIGKVFGNQSENYSNLIENTNKTQTDLQKLINKNKASGKDVTKLEGLYAEGQKQLRELGVNLKEETNLPSTAQTVGQLGGTALDILTAGTYGKLKTAGMSTGVLNRAGQGFAKTISAPISTELGKVADVTSGGKGLFTKQGGLSVLKGAGIGYGFDVTQGLQGLRGEDRTGVNSLVPGFGTVIGGGIPLISQSYESILNIKDPQRRAEALIQNRQRELNKLDDYIQIRKQTEKGLQRGIDIKKTLAETDVLHGAVDRNGTIHTLGKDGAVEQYRKLYVDGNEAIVSEALKKENKSIAPNVIESRLKNAIKNSGLEGRSLIRAEKAIQSEMAGYRRRAVANGTIPLVTVHNAKVDKYSNINFLTDAEKQKYEKAVAKTLKEIVEQYTESIDARAVNRELSKHFAVMGYLEKLDNKKVEGGRLGKYFAKTIGAIVGGHFGPIGSMVGAEVAGGIKGNLMSKAFSGKTGNVQPQAQAITEAKNFLAREPLLLGQSNKSGSLNINQANTSIATKNTISKTLQNKKNK